MMDKHSHLWILLGALAIPSYIVQEICIINP